MDEALRLVRNLIRIGKVSSVKPSMGSVQVLFEDRDRIISSDIPVIESASVPSVGDTVLCLFLGNGLEDGFCLGRFYSRSNPPV